MSRMQRRLADAVGADERRPVAVADGEADVRQEVGAAGQPPAEVADLDRAHGRTLLIRRSLRGRPFRRRAGRRAAAGRGRPPRRRRRRARAWRGPAATLTRTGWPPTSTVTSSRRCGQRRTVAARTPRLPVSASSTAATRSTSAGSTRACDGVRRAALLHHDRRRPGVVGAGGEQGGDRVGEDLAGDVVDVDLELARPRGPAPASALGSASVPTRTCTTFGRPAGSAVPAP